MENKETKVFIAKVLSPNGEWLGVCYPTRLTLNYIVLGGRGGVLLDVDIEVTKSGWRAKSRAGNEVVAERAGKLRDKTVFVL